MSAVVVWEIPTDLTRDEIARGLHNFMTSVTGYRRGLYAPWTELGEEDRDWWRTAGVDHFAAVIHKGRES